MTALDALTLINFLNELTSDGTSPKHTLFPSPSYELNGDGAVSPVDVLSVINLLNAPALETLEDAAEGEWVGGADRGDSSGLGPAPLSLERRRRPSAPASLSATNAAFADPESPGSPLDAILPEIAEDVYEARRLAMRGLACGSRSTCSSTSGSVNSARAW